jgi:hypothetical protein
MKSTAAARADALPLIRVRFSDCLELIRPRIAAGFCLASAGGLDLARPPHTLVGLALVTGGASCAYRTCQGGRLAPIYATFVSANCQRRKFGDPSKWYHNTIVTRSIGLALNDPFCLDPAGRRGFRDPQVLRGIRDKGRLHETGGRGMSGQTRPTPIRATLNLRPDRRLQYSVRSGRCQGYGRSISSERSALPTTITSSPPRPERVSRHGRGPVTKRKAQGGRARQGPRCSGCG